MKIPAVSPDQKIDFTSRQATVKMSSVFRKFFSTIFPSLVPRVHIAALTLREKSWVYTRDTVPLRNDGHMFL